MFKLIDHYFSECFSAFFDILLGVGADFHDFLHKDYSVVDDLLAQCRKFNDIDLTTRSACLCLSGLSFNIRMLCREPAIAHLPKLNQIEQCLRVQLVYSQDGRFEVEQGLIGLILIHRANMDQVLELLPCTLEIP